MSGDYINTKLITVVVQENGIIRDCDGLFLARLDRDISFSSLNQTQETEDRTTELERALEKERMRLAACGVVAMANTKDSAIKARDMLPDYESASCHDVAAAVDREMALRDQVESLQRQLAERGPQVPVGWQLVPVDPTPDMSAFHTTGVHWQIAERIYAAMLAAAPQSEVNRE